MNALDHLSMHDGVAMTVELFEPHWLGVYRFDDMTTGKSWRTVYRAVQLREDRPPFDRARALIGAGELRRRELVDDEVMMGLQAERSVYGIPR
ncbi:hypothetical protein NLB33_27020 [Mycolicibacterium smegmatis]|uniref:hypothetical protein n=1 Tax=Mycolicibacterium smegmatis TaxID=1772 RepID=UPI0020A54CAE|nr:hypothetical protein [Mycolicibacterium smegmatis]MCP2626500.1 hypothetical protein [Mycolicibacterium smegmatis]